jgi:hypothetical protein
MGAFHVEPLADTSTPITDAVKLAAPTHGFTSANAV